MIYMSFCILALLVHVMHMPHWHGRECILSILFTYFAFHLARMHRIEHRTKNPRTWLGTLCNPPFQEVWRIQSPCDKYHESVLVEMGQHIHAGSPYASYVQGWSAPNWPRVLATIGAKAKRCRWECVAYLRHFEFARFCNVFGLKLWRVSKTCPMVTSIIKRISVDKFLCALGVTPQPVKAIISAVFNYTTDGVSHMAVECLTPLSRVWSDCRGQEALVAQVLDSELQSPRIGVIGCRWFETSWRIMLLTACQTVRGMQPPLLASFSRRSQGLVPQYEAGGTCDSSDCPADMAIATDMAGRTTTVGGAGARNTQTTRKLRRSHTS